MTRRLATAPLLILLLSGAGVAEETRVGYRFDLSLDPASGVLQGQGTLRFRNDADSPVGEIPLILYGARFREQDPGITDQNFDRYYVRWFDAGDMVLGTARVAGAPLQVRTDPRKDLPRGCLSWLKLPTPLAPGAQVEVELTYELTVPDRLGSFGRRWGRVVLDGGALPFVPGRGRNGAFAPGAPPPLADYDLALSLKDTAKGGAVILGSSPQANGRTRFRARAPFVAAGADLDPLLEVGAKGDAPAVRVFGELGDDERAARLARIALDVGSFFRREYLPADAPQGALTFVEAPLRDRFTQVTDDVVLFSDRLFHLFVLFRGFHELEVGRAVIQALTRRHLRDLDLGADRDWICEGVAWIVATDWVRGRRGLKGSDVRTGMEWLSFIPVFDQLINAPRFTGSDLFYGRFYESAEAIPDAFPRAFSRRPRGRIVFEKLRDVLGTSGLQRLLFQTLGREANPDRAALRRCASNLAGVDLGAFFALWLGPTPKQNLSIDGVTVRDRPDGKREVQVDLRREGDARIGAVGEPVEVEGEGEDGKRLRLRWGGVGMRGQVTFTGDAGLFAPIRIDPDRRILQTKSADDVDPYFPVKILFNRLRVRIDLNHGNRNEAAVGMTLHPLHDYAHAIHLDAFYEQDERGLFLGYGYGFGKEIDERTFGTAVRATLVTESLNSGVLAGPESEGDLISFGVGFGFDTRLNDANPTWGIQANFGLEYGDRILGSDFRFNLYSGSIGFVYSLVRGTKVAVEVLLGQMTGRRAPTQRLFDAGGDGTIRGVKTSKFVDTALFAVRSEIRQLVVEDLDIPLFWLVWLRKVQVVAFMDTGEVGDTIESIIRKDSYWKWGAGGGIRLHIDSFGVTPLVVRFDVGVQFDAKAEHHDPQYYLGVGQSF